LKLSEAILAGSKSTFALRHRLFRETPRRVYACALGAACYAKDPSRLRIMSASELDDSVPTVAVRLFPELEDTVELTVAQLYGDEGDETDQTIPYQLGRLIVDLNDDETWSRPRIARLVAELGY
jgi:hypothetical protein